MATFDMHKTEKGFLPSVYLSTILLRRWMVAGPKSLPDIGTIGRQLCLGESRHFTETEAYQNTLLDM